MNTFETFMQTVAALPDYVSLLACPVLVLVVGLLLAVFHRKRAYPPVALALGGAGVFLVSCGGGLLLAVAWAGLYAVWAALVSLLFLFSFRSKKGQNRAEQLYEKFRLGLDVPADGGSADGEEEPSEPVSVDMEESVRLSHVYSLLEKLRAEELSPRDRLETDAIAHTLEGFRGKTLSADELTVVNDSLASVLKLTAKYKL